MPDDTGPSMGEYEIDFAGPEEPDTTERAMKKTRKTIRLEIVFAKTGKVVETVDVTDKSEQMIEKVMLGMLRNMDTDNYFIREVS